MLKKATLFCALSVVMAALPTAADIDTDFETPLAENVSSQEFMNSPYPYLRCSGLLIVVNSVIPPDQKEQIERVQTDSTSLLVFAQVLTAMQQGIDTDDVALDPLVRQARDFAKQYGDKTNRGDGGMEHYQNDLGVCRDILVMLQQN